MTLLPKPKKPWRSEKYRKFVSGLPCCLCRMPGPNDPHHFQREGEGIMGGKVCDSQILSLCHTHHRMLHDHGRVKWKDWDRDPEELIAQTQAEWLRRGNRAGWLE